MIRMRLIQNRTYADKRLYIGQPYSVTAGEFGHVPKDKAHVFASWEDGKFVTSDWVNKCFALSGFNLYEPEEV
jgi:hypothetical protein